MSRTDHRARKLRCGIDKEYGSRRSAGWESRGAVAKRRAVRADRRAAKRAEAPTR